MCTVQKKKSLQFLFKFPGQPQELNVSSVKCAERMRWGVFSYAAQRYSWASLIKHPPGIGRAAHFKWFYITCGLRAGSHIMVPISSTLNAALFGEWQVCWRFLCLDIHPLQNSCEVHRINTSNLRSTEFAYAHPCVFLLEVMDSLHQVILSSWETTIPQCMKCVPVLLLISL